MGCGSLLAEPLEPDTSVDAELDASVDEEADPDEDDPSDVAVTPPEPGVVVDVVPLSTDGVASGEEAAVTPSGVDAGALRMAEISALKASSCVDISTSE